MSENETQSSNILLFFHPNSQACIKLRDIVAKSKKNKNLKYINIDDLESIPSHINSIPCLIINNNQILNGKEVFQYFNKEDEDLQFLGFSSKLGSSLANFYSSIDDENEITGTLYSSIDSPNMNEGIPTYNENQNNSVKMEDITSQRANLDKELGLGNKPNQNI